LLQPAPTNTTITYYYPFLPISTSSGNPSSSVDFIDLSSSPAGHHSSTITIGSSPPHPNTHTPSSTSPQVVTNHGPDYSRWQLDWYTRFPCWQLAPNTRVRACWWLEGYRLEQADAIHDGTTIPDKCVCMVCVAKKQPSPRSSYSFIATIVRSIIVHLSEAHEISRADKKHATRKRNQTTIFEALQFDSKNPTQQALLGRTQSVFNAADSHLKLLDWILIDGLPFSVVSSERFRSFVESINPMCWIPSRQRIKPLIEKKYQYAVPHVKHLLHSAKRLIHLTFDGWTFRQNVSYLGINAHFMDGNWKQHRVIIGLMPFTESHTGSYIAKTTITILEFWGVENRCVIPSLCCGVEVVAGHG
jgi:hypothetical protein